MPTLTIVLPCYNPSPHWEERVLQGYNSIIQRIHITPEVIVVNDGSPHAIPSDKIEFLKAHIPHFIFTGYAVNKGKGAALRHGITMATGDLIIFTDIDFPYTSESFANIWQQLNEGKDIVIGIKDKEYYKRVPPARKHISKLLRRFSRLFLNIPVTDTQCGLKGFNQQGKKIFLSTTIDRYLCDLEFVYKSFKTTPALHIATQEIKLKEGVKFSRMNSRILASEFYNFIQILISQR